MITHITQNDLILLAYNELPPDQHRKFMEIVKSDPKLSKELEIITKQMDVLDSAFCMPHNTTIQIIKEESCSSSPMEMI